MYLRVREDWACPDCNGRGVITGRSDGGVAWAECITRGTMLDPTMTRNHQERLKAQREGRPPPPPLPEPALD